MKLEAKVKNYITWSNTVASLFNQWKATLEFTQQSISEMLHLYVGRFLNSQISFSAFTTPSKPSVISSSGWSTVISDQQANFYFWVELSCQWSAGRDKNIFWIWFPRFLHFPDFKEPQENCNRKPPPFVQSGFSECFNTLLFNLFLF